MCNLVLFANYISYVVGINEVSVLSIELRVICYNIVENLLAVGCAA